MRQESPAVGIDRTPTLAGRNGGPSERITGRWVCQGCRDSRASKLVCKSSVLNGEDDLPRIRLRIVTINQKGKRKKRKKEKRKEKKRKEKNLKEELDPVDFLENLGDGQQEFQPVKRPEKSSVFIIKIERNGHDLQNPKVLILATDTSIESF
jgi:hypothetical protein